MDRAEAISLIQVDLGFRTDLDSEIIAAMKAAQIELEQDDLLPWFLMTSEEITNGASDFDQIDLPTGWLGEQEEESGLWLLDESGGDRIRQLERDDLYAVWSGVLPRTKETSSDEGDPEFYAISGSTIYLGPLVPTEQLYFHYRYLKKAEVLDSNIENAWLEHAPAVLYNFAGAKIATGLRDRDASAIFMEKYQRARAALRIQHERRMESGTSPQMRYTHEY